jgi:hypothetical protein
MKALIAAAAAACFAVPAAASAANCAPRDKVVERLKDKYGEIQQSIGLGQRGAIVETFASEASGSWTITVTTPNGVTCMIASGQSFQVVRVSDEGDPV